jgi:hypothetical protein
MEMTFHHFSRPEDSRKNRKIVVDIRRVSVASTLLIHALHLFISLAGHQDTFSYCS